MFNWELTLPSSATRWNQVLPVPSDSGRRQFMFDEHRSDIDGGLPHASEEDVEGERANG